VNNVRSDVNRAIWRVFKQYGIKIPMAQREIRIVERVPMDDEGRPAGSGRVTRMSARRDPDSDFYLDDDEGGPG